MRVVKWKINRSEGSRAWGSVDSTEGLARALLKMYLPQFGSSN